jgi:hypothetical protein
MNGPHNRCSAQVADVWDPTGRLANHNRRRPRRLFGPTVSGFLVADGPTTTGAQVRIPLSPASSPHISTVQTRSSGHATWVPLMQVSCQGHTNMGTIWNRTARRRTHLSTMRSPGCFS